MLRRYHVPVANLPTQNFAFCVQDASAKVPAGVTLLSIFKYYQEHNKSAATAAASPAKYVFTFCPFSLFFFRILFFPSSKFV